MNDDKRRLKIEKKHYRAVFNTIYCRTAKIGVTKYGCLECDKFSYIYRSCKNRFCARCGNADTIKWAQNALSRLANIKHHHVVFTLPKALRHIAKLNEVDFYNILFRSTSKAIVDWFYHKHKVKPGIVSVLHTSGSDLKYHPHIHVILTGGGLDLNTNQIIEFKSDYLTRQRFLASKFQQYFFKQLFQHVSNKKLILPKRFNNDHHAFFKWARTIRDKQWIVSIQKPLNDIKQIVGYVGRYTKRACLSEYKIHNVTNDRIDILFNDYKNTPKNHKPLQSIKSFSTTEFFDQLLQHVPHKNFRMVRYYGIYTSHYKHLLNNQTQETSQQNTELDHTWSEFGNYRKLEIQHGKPDPLICPNCKNLMSFVSVIYSNQSFINDS